MKDYTPYIIAAITLIVSFCVWVVKLIYSFDKKITLMKGQVEGLEKIMVFKDDVDKEHRKELLEENETIKKQLSIISEALAIAKNTMDILLLKNLKTHKA